MPRFTGTVVTDAEGNNATKSHLSTNIIIMVGPNPIGAIQQLEVTEARGQITMVDEVGTDGHIDSAPTRSTNYNVTCQRVRFDRMRIAEAFSRGFMHVHAQRIPFDIQIHDRFHDADPANAIITTLKNLWIERIGYTYSADNWLITENMSLQGETIFSVYNGTNSNVVGQTTNNGAIITDLNPFERSADRGNFGGALDAPGLMNAILGD